MTHPSRHILSWLLIFGLLGAFLYLTRSVLLPFILGVVIAYFFHPLCDWLTRKRIPRGAAAGGIVALLYLIGGVLITALAPIIVEQTTALLHSAPEYLSKLRHDLTPQIQHLMRNLPIEDPAEVTQQAASQLSDKLSGVANNILQGLLRSGSAIISLISLLIITPMVGFYLLRDWSALCARIDHLYPRKYAATIREQLGLIDQTIAGFVRGQINMCLILAVYYTIALSVIHINFSFALGILAGLLLIIPMVGTLTSAAITLTIAWFQFGAVENLLNVAVVYAIGMLIDNIFTPKLVGQKIGLHPVWIIFGMFCGGVLLGFVGVLLAIPLTAVIGVVIRFAIAQYLQSSLYHDASSAS